MVPNLPNSFTQKQEPWDVSVINTRKLSVFRTQAEIHHLSVPRGGVGAGSTFFHLEGARRMQNCRDKHTWEVQVLKVRCRLRLHLGNLSATTRSSASGSHQPRLLVRDRRKALGEWHRQAWTAEVKGRMGTLRKIPWALTMHQTAAAHCWTSLHLWSPDGNLAIKMSNSALVFTRPDSSPMSHPHRQTKRNHSN